MTEDELLDELALLWGTILNMAQLLDVEIPGGLPTLNTNDERREFIAAMLQRAHERAYQRD